MEARRTMEAQPGTAGLPATIAAYAWRVVVGGLVFATGLVVSRLLFQSLDSSPPRFPDQAPEEIAVYYLLVGSLALALGMAPVARGLGGTLPIRVLVSAAFLFVGFAVGTSIEASIFSSVEGTLLMIAVLPLPCLLLAGTLASLLRPPGKIRRTRSVLAAFFRGRDLVSWAWRLAAALLAFPVVYFLFGLLVSPIVKEWYREGVAGLALPHPAVILAIQLLRSVLFLAVTLPVMAFWASTRRRLILALGSAFFVFVAAYDVVLANRVPTVLVVTHGLEVLADSFVYAWLLVRLLGTER
jgi:hypothetical protein